MNLFKALCFINIIVNGDSKTIDDSSVSIKDLLKILSVENPEVVSIQLNGTFVDQKEYGSTEVKNNDAIDFLYFMGGGK